MSERMVKRRRKQSRQFVKVVPHAPPAPRGARRALGRVVPPPSIRVIPRRMDRRVFRLVDGRISSPSRPVLPTSKDALVPWDLGAIAKDLAAKSGL